MKQLIRMLTPYELARTLINVQLSSLDDNRVTFRTNLGDENARLEKWVIYDETEDSIAVYRDGARTRVRKSDTSYISNYTEACFVACLNTFDKTDVRKAIVRTIVENFLEDFDKCKMFFKEAKFELGLDKNIKYSDLMGIEESEDNFSFAFKYIKEWLYWRNEFIENESISRNGILSEMCRLPFPELIIKDYIDIYMDKDMKYGLAYKEVRNEDRLRLTVVKKDNGNVEYVDNGVEFANIVMYLISEATELDHQD